MDIHNMVGCFLVLLLAVGSSQSLSNSSLPPEGQGHVVQRNQCICSSRRFHRKCRCCSLLTVSYDKPRKIRINDTVCANIKTLRSQTGFRFDLSWNGKSLISHRLPNINVRRPFCVATPYIHYVDICLKFKDLKTTRNQTSGCVDFEIDSLSSPKINLHGGCFSVSRGRTAGQNEKNHFLMLLKAKKTRRVRLVNMNKSPWKDLFKRKSLNVTNRSAVVQWVGRAGWRHLGNRSTKSLLHGHDSILPLNMDKISLSKGDCWCHQSFFVMCECCVPIVGPVARYRGCVKLKHFPYHKDLTVSITVDSHLKIQQDIPSDISTRLCSHHKMPNTDFKVGVCIKPSKRHSNKERRGLCINMDARKTGFRFKHSLGCVYLAVAKQSQAIQLYGIEK